MDDDIAIRVEDVSKRYRIGLKEEIPDSLIGALGAWVRTPFRNLQNLRRLSRFDDTDAADVLWALRDINFEVKRGEILGLIGANGAGKSTLLKVLSRITKPSSGRIELRGRVASLLEVGTGFNAELTGRENVYLNGTILGMTKAEIDAKFDEIVDFSGVETFIDTPVKRYSSGMTVRLAFAVAAHLEPEILLVDEVLAVGDVAFQKKCLSKMDQVTQDGRTIIFVSHNMNAMGALTARCLHLQGGRITMDGETRQVIAAYLKDGEVAITSAFSVDLREARRRKTFDRAMSLTDLTILDADGGPVDALYSGEGYRFRLGYTTDLGRIRAATFNVAVESQEGDRLAYCSSDLTAPVADLRGSGHVDCVVPRLPLMPGTYHLTVSCKLHGTWADHIKEALQITVTDGGFYGDSPIPGPLLAGMVAIDHGWEPVPPSQ